VPDAGAAAVDRVVSAGLGQGLLQVAELAGPLLGQQRTGVDDGHAG
jgi:hypothetical protein